MAATLIDLIRHGEPVGGRRFRGNGVDDPLSENGWRQMWEALDGLAPWDQIITSPLQRCRMFAQALAVRHALPLSVDADFMEIGMGAWEGRAHAEIEASEPERYLAFRTDPLAVRPPDAEPLDAFQARIAAAYRRQVLAYPGRHLLIVCHAGVTRAILTHALSVPLQHWYRVRVDYAALTRIRVGRSGIGVDWVNRQRMA